MNRDKNHLKHIGVGGFTFIEVIISLAVFSIGFLALSKMQLEYIRGNAEADMQTEAIFQASDKMDNLMFIAYNTPPPGNDIYVAWDTNVPPNPDSEEYTEPRGIYTLDWTVQYIDGDGIVGVDQAYKSIQLTTTWVGDDGTQKSFIFDSVRTNL